MNKKFKFASAVLSAGLLITPVSGLVNHYDNVAKANNYSNIKIGEKLYLNKQEQYVIINKKDYFVTEYIIDNNKIYNVIIKNKELNKEEYQKYMELAKKDIEKLPEDRAFPIYAAIILATSVVGTGIAVDSIYYKPDRDELDRLEAFEDGWISISRDLKTMWFYKEHGKYKKGWHWDNYYNAWYYFYEIKFVSPIRFDINAGLMYNPSFEKSKWLKINNKWYEFEYGGKLIQHSGWRKYNNKWLYHIPGDYGAVASQGLYIDGKWYNFDSNGYWI